MKVNDPKLSGMTPEQVGGPQATELAAERQKKLDANRTESRDQVTLTSLTAKIRELQTDSPERAARLERLRAEVQAGRYRVDPAEVSKNIVDEAIVDSPIERK